jgi:predicted Zn finger-like uncharacterized protein
MDVRCTRCGTEYEFDDALISERGTSVRCTQCGHQFKVFPPQLATMGPDEWVVLTSLGRRVVYRSLRELQNGISKSEVAREDLLARGSKPPRPLGSIAELDPLFATKAAPERQPSTLTGVAPPPGHAQARSMAPADAAPGRRGHDTFSGVAPPPNQQPAGPSDPQGHPLAHAGRPLRVGGTRTVLGIGTSTDEHSSSLAPIRMPTEEVSPVSTSPETRSFESPRAPNHDQDPRSSPARPADPVTYSSEPPTNRPAASAQANADAALPFPSDVTAPLVVPPESVQPGLAQPLQVQPESSFSRAATTRKFERQGSDVKTSPKTDEAIGRAPPAPKRAPPVVDVPAPASADRFPTKPSEPALSMGATLPSSAAQSAAVRPEDVPVQAEDAEARGRDDAETLPPTRPRIKPSRAAVVAQVHTARPLDSRSAPLQPSSPGSVGATRQEPKSRSIGRIAIAVGLLVLGLFVGIVIAGPELRKQKQKPTLGPAQGEPAATSSSRPLQPTWEASMDELLKTGDEQGAEQLLSNASATDQVQPRYRSLRVRALAMSADMAWWKVQLIGKAAGDAYTQSKKRLLERLERLSRDLAAVGQEEASTEQIQAATLDARRMQGDKSEPVEPALVERLKHPTTTELSYTQLVLGWVRAGVPDDATVEGLRRVRSAGLDLGPHAVALVVALAQLNRFDDAKAELARLASQPRPHPLHAEMVGYVSTTEKTHGEVRTDRDTVTLGAGAESGDLDPDLAEGDFRKRLTRANQCLAHNQLTKAHKLLRSVLAQRPNDTEAITAMADLLRRRGSTTESRDLYDKALALNANYLPAISGAADLRWQSGDRAGAAALYRRVIERVGETPGYGQVAAARLRELEGTPKPAADSAGPAGDRERAKGSP